MPIPHPIVISHRLVSKASIGNLICEPYALIAERSIENRWFSTSFAISTRSKRIRFQPARKMKKTATDLQKKPRHESTPGDLFNCYALPPKGGTPSGNPALFSGKMG